MNSAAPPERVAETCRSELLSHFGAVQAALHLSVAHCEVTMTPKEQSQSVRSRTWKAIAGLTTDLGVVGGVIGLVKLIPNPPPHSHRTASGIARTRPLNTHSSRTGQPPP